MIYFKTWQIMWSLMLLKDVSATTLTAEELLKELSWSLRLKLLNEMAKDHHKQNPVENSGATNKPSEGDTSPVKALLRQGGPSGVQSIKDTNPYLRADETENAPDDENDMRLKLFRLMYETVRDSDLKVKRAELIKDYYTNSSSFEVGYLIGDITDKNNIIQDIAMTLNKFHREWKPIEHINAYEQIANQGIEITHLTDLIRLVVKREPTEPKDT